MGKKVRVRKLETGDMTVLRSEVFGRDLFEGTVGRPSTYGKADHDAGGDHAWPDESGKYLWVSTFRTGNPGVHMLDYETGELIYSVHGMDSPCRRTMPTQLASMALAVLEVQEPTWWLA